MRNREYRWERENGFRLMNGFRLIYKFSPMGKDATLVACDACDRLHVFQTGTIASQKCDGCNA